MLTTAASDYNSFNTSSGGNGGGGGGGQSLNRKERSSSVGALPSTPCAGPIVVLKSGEAVETGTEAALFSRVSIATNSASVTSWSASFLKELDELRTEVLSEEDESAAVVSALISSSSHTHQNSQSSTSFVSLKSGVTSSSSSSSSSAWGDRRGVANLKNSLFVTASSSRNNSVGGETSSTNNNNNDDDDHDPTRWTTIASLMGLPSREIDRISLHAELAIESQRTLAFISQARAQAEARALLALQCIKHEENTPSSLPSTSSTSTLSTLSLSTPLFSLKSRDDNDTKRKNAFIGQTTPPPPPPTPSSSPLPIIVSGEATLIYVSATGESAILQPSITAALVAQARIGNNNNNNTQFKNKNIREGGGGNGSGGVEIDGVVASQLGIQPSLVNQQQTSTIFDNDNNNSNNNSSSSRHQHHHLLLPLWDWSLGVPSYLCAPIVEIETVKVTSNSVLTQRPELKLLDVPIGATANVIEVNPRCLRCLPPSYVILRGDSSSPTLAVFSSPHIRGEGSEGRLPPWHFVKLQRGLQIASGAMDEYEARRRRREALISQERERAANDVRLSKRKGGGGGRSDAVVQSRADLYKTFMGITSLPDDPSFLTGDVYGSEWGGGDVIDSNDLKDALLFPALSSSPSTSFTSHGGGGGGISSPSSSNPSSRWSPTTSTKVGNVNASLSFSQITKEGHTTMAFPTLAEAMAKGNSSSSNSGGGKRR